MTNDDFLPFTTFIQSVEEARHEDYGVPRDEFEAIRSHILEAYEGVEVTQTFVDPAGQTFDCVPIDQQPSVRGTAAQRPRPPEPPPLPDLGLPGTDRPAAESCAPGTVPMRRITIEEIIRHGSLEKFHQKSPFGGRHPREPLKGADDG
jgi:hypothetical protein